MCPWKEAKLNFPPKIFIYCVILMLDPSKCYFFQSLLIYGIVNAQIYEKQGPFGWTWLLRGVQWEERDSYVIIISFISLIILNDICFVFMSSVCQIIFCLKIIFCCSSSLLSFCSSSVVQVIICQFVSLLSVRSSSVSQVFFCRSGRLPSVKSSSVGQLIF